MKKNANKSKATTNKGSRKMTRKEEEYYKKHYYLQHSDTEHGYSDELTDRQFMWVDYCLCQVIEEIGDELHNTGNYAEWDRDTIRDAVNETFARECLWCAENYDEWYDPDEETTKERIREGIDQRWDDHEDIINDDYNEWLNVA